MTDDWRNDYEIADDAYGEGKYPESLHFAEKAVGLLANDLTLVLRKAAWAARQIGFKNETARAEMYEIARKYARAILAVSNDPEMRNSAIKLLMLLPGENYLELCKMGIEELEKAQFLDESIREDLLGELKNSYGIEVRRTDPMAALVIFEEAYRRVRKGTKIAGHLLQNTGTCWLMLKNKVDDVSLKLVYANRAIPVLEKAIKEYPFSEVEHRISTQNKIDKTKEEIINLEQQNAS